jgi:hypothetical protein
MPHPDMRIDVKIKTMPSCSLSPAVNMSPGAVGRIKFASRINPFQNINRRRDIMLVKRSAAFAIIFLTGCTFLAGNASAQIMGTIKDVEQPAGFSGKVDWTTGVLTAVGIGAPAAQSANAVQARAMAERAAQVVAYRNLLEALKGVRVDSTATVENFISTNERIRAGVSGIIQGATIMDKKYMSDGSVEVTVGMRLTGALAEALLPKTLPTPATGLTGTAPASPGQLYTGLIVDARGLDVKPAIAPKILNEEGKEVYGSSWISRDYAVREGMVSYLKDTVQAQTNPRVADKPLMVKAIKVAGDTRVDTVITNADAAMLHSASENLSILQKCRVIILVD